MNLYELTEKYKQIQELIENGSDNLDDTLESLDDAIDDKLIGYASIIRNLEADVNAIKEEKKRLSDKQRTLENSIERLKDNVKTNLKATGKSKLKAGLFTLSLAKTPPKAVILDDKAIPKHYYIEQQPVLDKRALLDALKQGEVKGAKLEQTESLRIKWWYLNRIIKGECQKGVSDQSLTKKFVTKYTREKTGVVKIAVGVVAKYIIVCHGQGVVVEW